MRRVLRWFTWRVLSRDARSWRSVMFVSQRVDDWECHRCHVPPAASGSSSRTPEKDRILSHGNILCRGLQHPAKKKIRAPDVAPLRKRSPPCTRSLKNGPCLMGSHRAANHTMNGQRQSVIVFYIQHIGSDHVSVVWPSFRAVLVL